MNAIVETNNEVVDNPVDLAIALSAMAAWMVFVPATLLTISIFLL